MISRFTAVLLVSLLSGAVLALDVPTQKAMDEKAERELCIAKIDGRMDRSIPDWGNMHHFCYALGFQSRAMRSIGRPTEFRSNIEQAIDNFNYVLNHTSPTFVMRPEVMIEKARTLQLANKTQEANKLFTEALILNPNLAAGYVALADQYSDTGNKAAALQIVKDGLRHAPDSRPLQRRYLQLGGKEPFPGAAASKKTE